jgi:ABC-type transport system involved in multi-copper enzyme maturation permease subunit
MDAQRSVVRRQTPSGWGAPTWWIVVGRELTDLWFGKGPIILILYSILLGGVSLVFSSNVRAGVFTPKELIWMLVQVAYNAGMIIGIGLGSDSFSGERDRDTLEGLLLTPASRTQIAVGKFLAAFSVWPVCLAIALPYLLLLTPDREVIRLALLWGGVCGTALAVGMIGLGMIVSALSNSNRVSMSASLGIYLVMLAPSQFTGAAQKGDVAKFVQWLDPIAAVDEFTEKLIVNMRTLHEVQTYLTPILGFAVLVLALLFLVVGPRLRLDGQMRLGWRRRAAAAGLVILLAAWPTLAAPAPAPAQPPLEISINKEYTQATAGDKIEFETVVKNPGSETVSNVVVALNVHNLGKGEAIDPEDWSPERTQYIEEIEPGASVPLQWTVYAVFRGKYLVYTTVVQKPAGPQATVRPVASSGINLTIQTDTSMNPGGMLPVALATTGGLSLGACGLRWARRRRIDAGTSR